MNLLSSAANHSSFIQRTVGSILSTLVTDCNGLVTWPNLLQELVGLCGTDSFYAFSAIERICEDAAFELIEHPQIFEPFLQAIFASLQNVRDERIKNSLLSILVHLIPTQSPLLTWNIGFMVSVVTGSAGEEVRITSCRLLSALIEFYWTFLQAAQIQQIFSLIMQWTLESKESPDSRDLLKQCLEFWLFQVQTDYALELFECASPSLLGQLIPLLIGGCSYDEEEDEEELCRAMEDLSVPDDPASKIRHHKLKGSSRLEIEESSDSDSEDAEEIVTSLRKCSAATLDGLSLAISSPVLFLEIFLPAFNERVGAADWKLREGALLAFGAVVEGLWQHLAPHLDQIAAFLVASAHSHPHPLVRSMALWTLSRISGWLVDGPAAVLPEGLRVLIGSLGDANKRVQQSACTALCKLLESPGFILSSGDCKSLTSAIFLAAQCYQKRSLLILYDLIRILAGSSPDLLAFDLEALQYWRSVAAVLVDRFGAESIADSSIFPIIEALMGLLLCDFEGRLLDPAKREEMHFKALNLAAQNLSAFTPELTAEIIVQDGLDDFLIAALDLLASAVESSKLLPSPALQPLLRNVLAASLLFKESSNVRQSAFALFGDYAALPEARCIFDSSLNAAYLSAFTENQFPSSLSATDSATFGTVVSMATATNAVWSLGEFALNQFNPVPIPHAIASSLLVFLRDRKSLEAGARIYFENVAVCLGRLLRSAGSSSNNLRINSSAFIHRIFNLLTTVESDKERYTAICGYIGVIRQEQLTLRDYQFILGKVDELIDFSSVNDDPLLLQNLTGFTHDIEQPPSSFYESLQPTLRSLCRL